MAVFALQTYNASRRIMGVDAPAKLFSLSRRIMRLSSVFIQDGLNDLKTHYTSEL